MIELEGAIGAVRPEASKVMRRVSRRRVLLLLGALCAALTGACAGKSIVDDHSDSVSGTPVSQADFTDRAAAAICDNIGACCASAGFALDRTGCEAFVRGSLDWDDPHENTIWDADAAGRCVEDFGVIARSCNESAADYAASCGHTLRGTLGEGQSCVDDIECADIAGARAQCLYDTPEPGGRCTADVRAAASSLGDPCDSTCSSDSCVSVTPVGGSGAPGTCYVEDGLVCNFDSATCERAPSLGEACPGYYCQSGAYCPDTGEGGCTASKPEGAGCVGDDECQKGSCSEGICGPRSIASEELCLGLN